MIWRRDWNLRDLQRLQLGCELGIPIGWISEELNRDVDECVDKAKELKFQVTPSTREGAN